MHTQKYLKCFAKPIKTLCILLVIMFLAGIAQIIVTEIYREFTRDQWDHSRMKKNVVELTEQEKQQWNTHNSGKSFAPDGTIYLISNAISPGSREKKFIVKDQQDKILFEGKEEDNPCTFIQWQPKSKNSFSRYRQQNLNELNLIAGEFSRYFVVPIVNDNNKRIGHWIFDTDKRIFKYYSIAGEQLGYIGANGYTEIKSETVGFEKCERMESWLRPNSYDPIMFYQTQNALYQIDFQNKQVDTLAKTDNDPIRRMVMNNWQEAETYDYRPSLAIFTNSNKFYLYLKNPEQVIKSQLPDDFPNYGTPMYAANDNTIYARYEETLGIPNTDDIEVLIAWWRDNQNKAKEHRIRLFEVDNTGNFSEKSSFVWTEPGIHPNVDYLMIPDTFPSVVNSLSSPVPLWATYHWLKTGVHRQWSGWGHVIMSFIQAYSSFKIFINLCVMAVFAALAFLHGWPRRTHIAKLIFWTVFVFLFNLPGFLTYLALNHTPIILCANCGKKRGLLQDACCRCGTALALPKAKETDLVMPLSA